MQINVHLAEPFWRAVGRRDLEVELMPGARIADLLSLLRRDYPKLAGELDETSLAIIVGDQEADKQTVLYDGNRVYLVWPVAGG